jgi:hypothetical protein
MVIYEPKNRIEVITPKGEGTIWLVTEYGYETDTMYTIIINKTGQLWSFTHKDIAIKNNITFNRGLLTEEPSGGF